MIKHCCEQMKSRVLLLHKNEADTDENKVVCYSPVFREYGIPVRGSVEEVSSYILIEVCPWCGGILPSSKRVEWFETLEKLGYDSPFEQDIPDDFKSEEWYKEFDE